MFKTIFAIFALIAAALAAPSPDPIPTAPIVASAPAHFISSYSAPIAYSGYHVPAAYSTYSASAFPVHTAYSYGTPFIYKR